MLFMATGKPAHLGCKFLSDVSVVNSPIVVEGNQSYALDRAATRTGSYNL